MQKLIVILVEPEEGLNIGFVARAMQGFFCDDLRIVYGEKKGLPDTARRTGVSALNILDHASIYPSLPAALDDVDYALAFTRRKFLQGPPVESLAAIELWHGSFALVFGRESIGLKKDEVALCERCVFIPCKEGFSFNLGQAVAMVLYELNGREREHVVQIHKKQLASRKSREAFLNLLESSVDSGWMDKGSRRETFRELLRRMEPDAGELDVLFGLVKAFLQ